MPGMMEKEWQRGEKRGGEERGGGGEGEEGVEWEKERLASGEEGLQRREEGKGERGDG